MLGVPVPTAHQSWWYDELVCAVTANGPDDHESSNSSENKRRSVFMAALDIPIARQEHSLSESTVILQVKFGLLGDSRKVSSSQVEVDTDKQLLRVAKKILVSNEFEAIKQIDRRVKKYLDSVCVPFETGTRFLAVPLIEDVDRKLREFERERADLVDRFLDS